MFDKVKLSWMNGQHIKALPEEQVRGFEGPGLVGPRRGKLGETGANRSGYLGLEGPGFATHLCATKRTCASLFYYCAPPPPPPAPAPTRPSDNPTHSLTRSPRARTPQAARVACPLRLLLAHARACPTLTPVPTRRMRPGSHPTHLLARFQFAFDVVNVQCTQCVPNVLSMYSMFNGI